MVKEIYKKTTESETKSDQQIEAESTEEVNNQTESTFLSENPASPLSKTAKKGTYNPMYQCPPQNNCYQPVYYPPPGPGGHCHPGGYPGGGGGQPGYYPNNPHVSRDRGGCGSFLQGILACTLCLACFKCCCCCCDECCDAAC